MRLLRGIASVLLVTTICVAVGRATGLIPTSASRVSSSVTTSSAAASGSGASDAATASSTSERPYPASLSADLHDDFDTICEDLDAGVLDVHVGASSDSDLDALFDAVRQTPDLFWVSGSGSYTRSILGTTMHFSEKYGDTAAVRTAVESVADSALSGLTADMGDYEKSVYLHDWLCEHVTYEASVDESDQDVYGALVNGRCVCMGYANAYCYLMRRAGVSCYDVEGTYDGESHAWNRSVLDGEVYYTDVTGDDQADATLRHDWLNVTSDVMGATHAPTYAEDMPASSATADNWYVRRGLMLSAYDVSELEGILASQDGDVLDVCCADADTYARLCALFQGQDAFDVLGDSGHPCRNVQYATSVGTYALQLTLS
ncbi:MAG: transglutaminase domain-containing protein [Atopobiaceae bacterium]|nr:hypothetical protein [Atopobiaceae bacterium]MCH4179915.1 hypothetical protein [Atopobiaceae bacterium]MCH4213666.1 hypothetical protein [Atopobiaceae bacterium]MCH4230193.1 hypothetical protein [Atopobiaceae bacterium]MCH4275977.1 hypothetical protein [Atopobiaceae bacterium]